MKKMIGKVIVTDEFTMFRRLSGNRSIPNKRIKKLIESISTFGYIGAPIVINEKNEVVDGQARIEACRTLAMPVPYTVVHGVGIEECKALNAYSTSWDQKDYIEMYAELGNRNYINLMNLMKEYKKLGLRTITFATLGRIASGTEIKMGAYRCSDGTYVMARKALAMISNCTPFLNRASGRKDIYANALLVFAYHPNADMEHLAKRMEQKQMDIISVGTVIEALTILEEIYNFRCKDKLYITTDYKIAREDEKSWFSSRFLTQGK